MRRGFNGLVGRRCIKHEFYWYYEHYWFVCFASSTAFCERACGIHISFNSLYGRNFKRIPPLLALLDSPSKAGAVLLLYFLIQQIEGNLVSPIIMQKQVSQSEE